MHRVPIGAHAIAVDDDVPTFWTRVADGRWEPDLLALLARHVGPGTCLVDCGAWVGPVSLYAAALGARVVAVEADPAALDGLDRNLAANPALAERVTVVRRALAPTSGPVRMGARRKPGDSMSSVLRPDAARSWLAPSVTPAELAATLPAGMPRLVKMDLEGAEYALLPALGLLLAGAPARLVVSFHPSILAETGEPDPAACALAAIASLPPHRAVPVGADGPVAPSRETLAEADTWLFDLA